MPSHRTSYHFTSSNNPIIISSKKLTPHFHISFSDDASCFGENCPDNTNQNLQRPARSISSHCECEPNDDRCKRICEYTSICRNDGTAQFEMGSITCLCPPGYYGEFCEEFNPCVNVSLFISYYMFSFWFGHIGSLFQFPLKIQPCPPMYSLWKPKIRLVFFLNATSVYGAIWVPHREYAWRLDLLGEKATNVTRPFFMWK